MSTTTVREAARDALLDEAVAAGVVPPAQRSGWSGAYDRAPVAATRALAGALRDGKALGLAAAAQIVIESSKPATGGATPQAAAPPKVARNAASGRLEYGAGFPVASGGGEHQVFTPNGWTKVSAFEAAGGTEDDLREALVRATSFGDTALARQFREGPS